VRTRAERDTLGVVRVPAGAYYGPETARALENFRISGRPEPRILVKALALVKAAAAEANAKTGKIEKRKAAAIGKAAMEVASGKFADQFLVDAFQAGAGTSFNMNMNEVVANRAIEILGGHKGQYSLVHPHDDVNASQSTNDTFPTAMRIAAAWRAAELSREARLLSKELAAKAREFRKIVTAGRTHLQDAVPITLGEEFSGYAEAMQKAAKRIDEKSKAMLTVNLGATAVGTGAGATPRYVKHAVARLSRLSRLRLTPAPNYFWIQQSMSDFVELSGATRTFATDFIRIANDIRLLASGPRDGLEEISLPAVQPGSSIMPGKVNPSIAEMADMVGFQVIGNDVAVAFAAQAGQLELNVFMPLIAKDVIESLELSANACRAMREKAVKGIKANAETCRRYAMRSPALATILAQVIGYDAAAKIAQEAVRRNKTIPEIVREKNLLTADQIRRLVDPHRLVKR
jgi:aspartate ammonia-lyase